MPMGDLIMTHHSRRAFLKRTLAASAAVGLGPAAWSRVFGGTADIGESPYGPLGDPDANGVRLPEGFSARLLATTGGTVEGTDYVWHGQPDGGATFAAPDGGWIYANNSELNGTRGGASAIRFDADGEVVDA